MTTLPYIVKESNVCLKPWVKYQDGNWYYFSEDQKGTFLDATGYCRLIGGYVVSFSSDAEYDIMENALGRNQNIFPFFNQELPLGYKSNTS